VVWVNRKTVALPLIAITVLVVVLYFSVSNFMESQNLPVSTPTPTPAPTPTPLPQVAYAKTGSNATMTVLSPRNMTYQNNTVALEVNIKSIHWLINGVFYSADWLSGYHPLYFYELQQATKEVNCTEILTNIPQGTHNVWVFAKLHDGTSVYCSVEFTVNSPENPSQTPPQTTPPEPKVTLTEWGNPHSSYPTKLTITSPENITYPTSNFTLKVDVTTAFWVISSVYYKADWHKEYYRIYSLSDSGRIGPNEAITLTANFTGIPEGSHKIEVVANYHDGSHASRTISFSTNSSTIP
jgi:hypothetical protein